RDAPSNKTLLTCILTRTPHPDARHRARTLDSGSNAVSHRHIELFLPLLLLCGGVGCGYAKKHVAAPQPPDVPVSRPVHREVTEYAEFAGRTGAVESVDIRARVTGYLVQTPFKEGTEVKKGDLLFEVDPRPYQAQLDQAEGQVNLYTAQLK